MKSSVILSTDTGSRMTLGKRRGRSIRFVAFLLVGVACTVDPVPIDEGGVTVRTDPRGRCDNEPRAVDAASPDPDSVTGDVDGDARDDRVLIIGDERGGPGCDSFLAVVTDGATYSTPVDPRGDPRALQEPSILGLTDIDGRAGDEIVVLIETGASTQFAGVFTLTTQGLERITLVGRGPGPFAAESAGSDLFAFGGSVGHLEAVDCSPAGTVVMSAATPVGASAASYRIERRYFQPEGTKLILDRSATESMVIEGLEVDRFAEFRGSPFLSCD